MHKAEVAAGGFVVARGEAAKLLGAALRHLARPTGKAGAAAPWLLVTEAAIGSVKQFEERQEINKLP
ncbi:hypothetical protein GCM10028822_32620 [Hymenobacter terrigena]